MTIPTNREETPREQSLEEQTLPPTPSAPTASFPSSDEVQEDLELEGTFGRYLILHRLGKGGMGRVYLARDTHLDRLIALKIPQLEKGNPSLVRERFYREARAAATLHHPNICPVYDVGAVGEIPYLTMAYIDGLALHDWARASPRSESTLLEMIRKIALALEEAHRHGIIHRDLKPSNVMIDRRAEPVIMDFGLARKLHLPEEARLTSPGILLGTPAYMSPESVLAEEEITPAADIYSLGVILYELLAGRIPFTGSVTAILAQVISDSPPPPSRWRANLSPQLDAICLRALAKKPHERFASMAEFAEELAVVQRTSPSCTSISDGASTEQSTAPFEVDPAPGLAEKILHLLRTWGWARALQKIRNRAQRSDTPQQRATYQAFLDWLTADHPENNRVSAHLQALPEAQSLAGWVLVGQASFALRDRDYPFAQKLLDKAASEADASDSMLQATILHTRATALVHRGHCDRALGLLHEALDRFGRNHFMTGRVLDTLGMAYAYKGNFPVAREFYEQSIRHKKTFDDEAGIAVSHGQLGRLYLEWGRLDQAELHFQEDLRLAQKLRSRWSEAQIYNHLGQVALARGERECVAGRKAAGKRQFTLAAGWLDQSIRYSQEGKYPVLEGFARKDRSLVFLHEGHLDRAEEQVRLALDLFTAQQFNEGIAKTQLVEGVLLQRRHRWSEAERRFRSALTYFESTQEVDKVVRALWEIARTCRDSGSPLPLVTRAYLDALDKAEACRHDHLVHSIEQELHEVDLEAYLRHVYRRTRGATLDEDSASLMGGVEEVATILAVDLPGFAEFSQGLDAETTLITFNHLLADFADVLARYQARVLTYQGHGFLALTWESRHAERAVFAGLELVSALQEFNRPRQLLGLPLFHLRIGIHSGNVFLGNVGTYRKLDFTAIGPSLNLARVLRNEASPGVPCIGRSTYDLVRDRFEFVSLNPRTIQVLELGLIEIFEVVRPRSCSNGF